jgi:hypothetical protein
MKLIVEPLTPQKIENLVDAFGNDQTRPFVPLGDEIPQRPADRPRHPHDLPLLVHQSELPVDFAHPLGVARPHPLEGFGVTHVEQDVSRGVNQIHEPFNGSHLMHDNLRFNKQAKNARKTCTN